MLTGRKAIQAMGAFRAKRGHPGTVGKIVALALIAALTLVNTGPQRQQTSDQMFHDVMAPVRGVFAHIKFQQFRDFLAFLNIDRQQTHIRSNKLAKFLR